MNFLKKIFGSGAKDAPSASTPKTPLKPLPPGTALNDTALTRFAFAFFGALAPGYSGKNLFVSPASVAFALMLAQNGARGETRAALAKTLQMENFSDADMQNYVQVLKTLLERNDPKVQLAIANSVWGTLGYDFKPSYLDEARAFFDAEARSVDFKLPSSADAINGWVSEKTRQKITSIVSARNLARMVFVLINALYFKGDWAEDYEFKKEVTRDGTFYLPRGTKTVPLMKRYRSYRYLQGPNFQMVRIPYGTGEIAFYAVLPAADLAFDAFVGALTAAEWEGWIARMQEMEGTLVMPRFKIEFDAELVPALCKLGFEAVLHDTADFSAMCDQPVAVSSVIHKTFVELNEKGTEAAAVTAVMMCAGCAMPQNPPTTFNMVVDRPFVCAIREERSGTLLFLGAIVEP